MMWFKVFVFSLGVFFTAGISSAVEVSGELKTWHKVTFTLEGPEADEMDAAPNPFTDYRLTATFRNGDDTTYTIPGFFAADGNASETGATKGNKWRVHFSPDRGGKWTAEFNLVKGAKVAISGDVGEPVLKQTVSFEINDSDKTGRDFRGEGRLQYVGKSYLQFAGSERYFLKVGADAPETLLGYADFDGTEARKAKKCPLKTWEPHLQDWKEGDPVWKAGKGKGLIGALNYLSGTGCNAFSFLTYNAGGDGDNVWPFAKYGETFHYDCSKLDQWGVVFDHATTKGLYLHFKLQETENDDLRKGKANGDVPAALDGGDLGPERKLYLRELIARFGHALALNWNLGEENTQSTEQQLAMAGYIEKLDAYSHPIVIHTYPDQQDKVYGPLLGQESGLDGASLQNSNVKDCHWQVVKWNRKSREAGKPWIVAFDEPGSAHTGTPPDPGYPGTPANFSDPSVEQVRKQALWGTLMGGGVGVEYYFGYKLPENDLLCEDWRSRAMTWNYSRIAIEFFEKEKIPFQEMTNADALVGNPKHDNSAYCLADSGKVYLVYLPEGGKREIDLSDAVGKFRLDWFNPRNGGELKGDDPVSGGGSVLLEAPSSDHDWLAVLRLLN